MPEFVTDCPRCQANKITFEVLSWNDVQCLEEDICKLELFAVCRSCKMSTTFFSEMHGTNIGRHLKNYTENYLGKVVSNSVAFWPIRLPLSGQIPCPDLVPDNIKQVFEEGTKCLAVGCNNAAGAMFRLLLDLSTKSKLPEETAEDGGPNRHVKGNLSARIKWLCKQEHFNFKLAKLADKIKLDGNDGVHEGNLTQIDAQDLVEFTVHFLENVYTFPEKLDLSYKRRNPEKVT